ncbi:hypothetical protein PsorP6_000014 [Peronosclerospora sorghi]|uniref:Uncharacterized protein n=1 Tax=Peronosclerospora sorghi TaxID=230839 RepID=A0ACC0WTE2_9STRA|nr:hypothetical protein PsorP6_000014 [Peronosclerospora sorghi]
MFHLFLKVSSTTQASHSSNEESVPMLGLENVFEFIDPFKCVAEMMGFRWQNQSCAIVVCEVETNGARRSANDSSHNCPFCPEVQR